MGQQRISNSKKLIATSEKVLQRTEYHRNQRNNGFGLIMLLLLAAAAADDDDDDDDAVIINIISVALLLYPCVGLALSGSKQWRS